MTDDPLDAMWARWNHIQASLFPWLREEVEPMTEQLGRLITILDVIGLQAFVPEPPRGPGRPPEDRRALARCFSARSPHQLQTHPRGPSFPLSRNASAKSPEVRSSRKRQKVARVPPLEVFDLRPQRPANQILLS